MKKPPLEKYVVKKILEHIKSRGGFAIKIHGSPFMLLGIPDIIACYRGRFVAFECKRDAVTQPTLIQRHMMKRITAAGGIATVIHTVEEASRILDRIDEELGGPTPRNH